MTKTIVTVFTDEQLEKLPLTYRKMEVAETINVGELYVDTTYSSSLKHFTSSYMIYNSYKPISNFLIENESD